MRKDDSEDSLGFNLDDDIVRGSQWEARENRDGGILLVFFLNNRNTDHVVMLFSNPASFPVCLLSLLWVQSVSSAVLLGPSKGRQKFHENSERGGRGNGVTLLTFSVLV